eukprot:11927887-Ditylum_brightwellii.AAC.1
MESVEETEVDLLVLEEQNKGVTKKNETASQRRTNREAEENSRKEPNLGETLVERRNTTIQSHKGNKQNYDNSLWGKKGNESINRRNVNENMPDVNTNKRNA